MALMTFISLEPLGRPGLQPPEGASAAGMLRGFSDDQAAGRAGCSSPWNSNATTTATVAAIQKTVPAAGRFSRCGNLHQVAHALTPRRLDAARGRFVRRFLRCGFRGIVFTDAVCFRHRGGHRARRSPSGPRKPSRTEWVWVLNFLLITFKIKGVTPSIPAFRRPPLCPASRSARNGAYPGAASFQPRRRPCPSPPASPRR